MKIVYVGHSYTVDSENAAVRYCIKYQFCERAVRRPFVISVQDNVEL
jgi:hypothetical protein